MLQKRNVSCVLPEKSAGLVLTNVNSKLQILRRLEMHTFAWFSKGSANEIASSYVGLPVPLQCVGVQHKGDLDTMRA